jgi:hypothetical protein
MFMFFVFRIFMDFHLLLIHLQTSNVFTIRDLVASAIISITPSVCQQQIINHISNVLKDKSPSNNDVHSCYLLCIRLLGAVESNKTMPLELLELFSQKKNLHFEVDYATHSLLIDLLVKLTQVLKYDKQAMSQLQIHIKITLSALKEQKQRCVVGQPFLEKSLAKAVAHCLQFCSGKN